MQNRSVISVSYTHLDVYKRQILDYIDMFEGTMNAGLKTFIIDTYKAQVEKLKELQDPKTGLWHTVLTAPDSYCLLYTSPSAL